MNIALLVLVAFSEPLLYVSCGLPVNRHKTRQAEKFNTSKKRVALCRVFVIRTEEDARQMAELHATGWKELMFTTYSFTHNGMYSYDAVNQARHVWESLRGIDRLKNALIISYDTHSCQVLWEHGIPCFLDRYLPQPRDLPGISLHICRCVMCF